MKSYPVFLALLLFASVSFASFTYLGSFNGTTAGDYTDQFLFSRPTGILYNDGILYVLDSGKSIMGMYNATDGMYSRIRGGIGARASSEVDMSTPIRLAYDHGTIYIADKGSSYIKTYPGTSSQIYNWNTGSALDSPTGIVVGNESLYISDVGKKQVLAYSRKFKSFSSVAIPTGGSDGKLSAPQDIEFYKGNYYVSDSDKGLVFVYDSNFTYLETIGRGLGGVTLISPHGIALANDRLFVTDTSSSTVVEFALDGYPVAVLDSSVPGSNLSYPEDIAVYGSTLYVADTQNKLVRVFSINETSGNNSVQQALTSAEAAIISLSQVKEAAKKVGVVPDADTFDSDLAQAKSDYGHLVYSSASSISQRIIDGVPVVKANLSQRVEVAIKQAVKQAADKVAPYRAQAKGNAATLVSAFDGKVADISSKLSGQFYSLAADISIGLSADADAIVDATVGNAAKEEQARKDKLASQVGLQIDLASTKLTALEGKLAAYRQNMNTSSYETILDNARKALSQEDYDSANKTASSLIASIDSQDTYLSQLAQGIDSANMNLSLLELEFNASASKPMLLPPDLSSERKQLESAKQMAYQNPALAVAMAQQALQLADVKVKDAQSLSVAAAAAIVMFGLILLIGLVFFLHIKGRKKHGLEAADSQPHGKRKRG